MTYEMIKFPSIESFAHVFRDSVRGLKVRPKIKLHGTNGGIAVRGGQVIAQSRNNLLIGTDNAGFAAFVAEQEELWSELPDCVVYGEWAGPGIQERDAVTMIPERNFFVFAVLADGIMITNPVKIRKMIPFDLELVRILQWEDDEIHINFENAETFASAVSERVEAIGVCDPYIKNYFGIEGPGEGLVYMPEEAMFVEGFCRSTFKVKAEAHRVRKSARAVNVKIDIPKDAVDFVLTFVTPARCQQAVQEACNGNRAPEQTREFLKWMGNDVRKESLAELEGMNVEWGAVAKFVNDAARRWYLAA